MAYKTGRILSVHGQQVIVETEGTQHTCVLAGRLKKKETEKKNLVIVGDIVSFDEGMIVEVHPRYSLLSRTTDNKQHLIAANIDQVLITTSLADPIPKPGLVDRYLIAAEKGNMTPIIVINKCDLTHKDPFAPYTELGYTVIHTSTVTGHGLDTLYKQMQDKASVFSGQSGVGKSTLINKMLGLDLPTGPVVPTTRKGAHTTTSAKLIPLQGGGWCIDTPGIKSFGVWDLDPKEIEGYFPEIHAVGQKCRYSNCTHTHEPDCAVVQALTDGTISHIRYTSYCALLPE